MMEGLGHGAPGRSRRYLALPERLRESFPERWGLEDVQGSPAKERDPGPKKECFLPHLSVHKTFCQASSVGKAGPSSPGIERGNKRGKHSCRMRLHAEKDMKQNKGEHVRKQ